MQMRVNALYWCGSGTKWKKCHRDALARQMPLTQIAKAQQRAQEWKALKKYVTMTYRGIRLKRLLLITLLVLSSEPAYAEWVAIGYSESLGGYTVHVDPDTIRRNGDLVKVWALTDYTTIQTVGDSSFLSSKAQNEFDCAEERQHELAVTWFSGNMGNGNGVWNNSDETNWRPVAPGSVGEGVWKFVCGCVTTPCRTQLLS